MFLHDVLSDGDGKPRIVKYPSWCSLCGCCQSTSSLVFPWSGDREYNHVEAHVDIAPVACGSHDQSMSICESVRLEQCPFQCSTPSAHPCSVYDLFLLIHRSSSILTPQKLVTSSELPVDTLVNTADADLKSECADVRGLKMVRSAHFWPLLQLAQQPARRHLLCILVWQCGRLGHAHRIGRLSVCLPLADSDR